MVFAAKGSMHSSSGKSCAVLMEWDGTPLPICFWWQDEAEIWVFSWFWVQWQLWLMLLSPHALILPAHLLHFTSLAYFRNQLLCENASISLIWKMRPAQPWFAPQSDLWWLQSHEVFCHIFHLRTHRGWFSALLGTMRCQCSPPEMLLTTFWRWLFP